MRVLVLGAAADQGLPLIGALKAAELEPVAGLRRPDAMASTAHSDVATTPADLERSESLAAAMSGCDALAMHLPFTFDRAQAGRWGADIASAARQAGIAKIVFNTSCYVAPQDIGVTGHDGRRDIIAAIAGSGVPYAIIEPVVFMDNIVRPWSMPSIARNGVFAYPAAETLRISWVAIDDVAAAMVAALRDNSLTDARIPLGGPEALTGQEVASVLSDAVGHDVRFQSLSPDRFAADMSALVNGSPDVQPHSIYAGMAAMYAWYNAQPVSPLATEPAALPVDVPLTPLRDWALRQNWQS
jgi:uncharacterized protein YbjT (DUF2867 family)